MNRKVQHHDVSLCYPLLSSVQARLETSWGALFVPARLKLDFLQKYSTLERALELPRTVYLLEIAGKVVPLREKVWRLHGKHEEAQGTDTFSCFQKRQRTS